MNTGDRNKTKKLTLFLPLRQIEQFLVHFWRGIPPHILYILGAKVVVDVVHVCDAIFYKAVAGVLMPTALQPIPESLIQIMRYGEYWKEGLSI